MGLTEVQLGPEGSLWDFGYCAYTKSNWDFGYITRITILHPSCIQPQLLDFIFAQHLVWLGSAIAYSEFSPNIKFITIDKTIGKIND